MENHPEIILDEKRVLRNKKRYVAKHLWRGLIGEEFDEIESPLFHRSLNWAKNWQVGLLLWFFAHIVSLIRRFKPR